MARTKKLETVTKISDGKKWEVIQGEVRDVCATLDEMSFDAVLCDPPYGLRPDGKTCTWDDIREGRVKSKGGFMGKEWDSAVPGPSDWEAVLRVMKPGAPLIAFFGTRTYHRGTCAIEDAGFLVEDMFSWLYGQGWPKGLNVSQAFDKRRYERSEILEVTKWIKRARDRAGVTNAQIDAAFGLNGMAGHWTSQKSQPQVPTLEQIPKLLEVLRAREEDVPSEIRDLIFFLNGRKGEPGEAWKGATIERFEDSGATALFNTPMSGPYAVRLPNSEQARLWEGYKTELKPACEPAVLAMRPIEGRYVDNCEKHGVGPLNVGDAKIGNEDRWNPSASPGRSIYEEWSKTPEISGRPAVGRYPSNVLLSHDPECRLVGSRSSKDTSVTTISTGEIVSENKAMSGSNYGRRKTGEAARPDEEVWECVERCPVRRLDAQAGHMPSTMTGRAAPDEAHDNPSDVHAPRTIVGGKGGGGPVYADSGGPSRIFHQSQASAEEIREVVEAFERFFWSSKASNRERGSKNSHPTVKPIQLMRYLARLLLPPRPMRILVPFCGSGSEMLGAMLAGWPEVVGIELDEKNCEIARWRIANATIRSTEKVIGG